MIFLFPHNFNIPHTTLTTTTMPHKEPPISHVIAYGFAFLLIFFAFIPSQAFATVTFGSFGALGVIILYLSFCASNLLAPFIVEKIGISISMTLGAVGYLPFVLSLSLNSEYLFIIGSITCGAGAALLWVGIGMAVTLLSTPSTRGRRFGVFSFVNRLNFIGNLSAALLFSAGISRGQVFWCLFFVLLAGCVLLGVLGYCILAPRELRERRRRTAAEDVQAVNEANETKKEEVNDTNKATQAAATPSGITCMSILQMFVNKNFLPFLVTNFIVSGLVKGWVFAVLTTWAPSNSIVGYMMAIFGVTIVLSAPFHGILFDRLHTYHHRTLILLLPISFATIGCCCVFYYRLLVPDGGGGGSSSVTTTTTPTPPPPPSIVSYLVGAGMFGVMCGGAENTINAGTSWMYSEKSSVAFAAKLLSECFGQVCGYLIIPIFGGRHVAQLVLLSVLLVLNGLVVGGVVCTTGKEGTEIWEETRPVVECCGKVDGAEEEVVLKSNVDVVVLVAGDVQKS